ncbi:MAG: hypothetical protein ACRDTS_23760, partial [Mycobacterium sp.]
CWDWDSGDEQVIDEFLGAGQARSWQRQLVVGVLAAALRQNAD